MKFLAKCAASISKTPKEKWVLLRLEAEKGHLLGEIAKELGELDQEKTYQITIEEVEQTNVIP